MKKKHLLWIIPGALIGSLLGVIVLTPLLVDVDRYRPEILAKANERLNGKLELGKLSLSLWGQIRVEIAGLSLKDANSQPVLSVTDAYVHFPFSSLFSGAPEMTLNMNQPQIQVLRGKDGKMNVMTLMKAGEATSPTPTAGTAATSQPGGAKLDTTALPALVVKARMGLDVKNGRFDFKDDQLQSKTSVQNLTLRLKNISLSTPTEIELGAELNTAMGTGPSALTVKGPMSYRGQIQPVLEAGKPWKVTASNFVDFSGISILMPGLFEKKAGMVASFELQAVATPDEFQVPKFVAKFLNAELAGKLNAKVPPQGSPQMQFEMASNAVDFAPWVDLIPMASGYGLVGSFKFSARASGPVDQLTYGADLGFDDVSAKHAMLKVAPKFGGKVVVKTDQIESFQLTMSAPETDLRVEGKLQSFKKPDISVAVTSKGVNVDAFVALPPLKKSPEGGAATGVGSGASAAAPKVPASDLDAMLEPLRSNPYASATRLMAKVAVDSFTVYGVRMTGIEGKVTLADLIFGIEGFGLKVFDGKIQAGFSTDLRPKAPTYRFSLGVDKLSLQKAVESQFQLFKNTLIGDANFKMSGTGRSFNVEPAMKNLKASGRLEVLKAKFASLDIMRTATEAVNQGLAKIADKVPNLKTKQIGAPGSRESRYDSISSDFTIEEGAFKAPNFAAKAEPRQGIDVNGTTAVTLDAAGGYPINAHWELVDTYDLLKTRGLSVQLAGVKVDNLLGEGDRPVRFPITVKGAAMSPQVSYTEVPEHLLKVALGKVGKVAEGKVKAEAEKLKAKVEQQAQKKVDDLTKQAAPKVENALKKGLKGLFGK